MEVKSIQSIQALLYNYRAQYLEVHMGDKPTGGFFATLSHNDYRKLIMENDYITTKFYDDKMMRYFMDFILDEGDGVRDGQPYLGTLTEKL